MCTSSMDDNLYLLVQLEKWRKIQGRYGKNQFLTTKRSKQTRREKNTLTLRTRTEKNTLTLNSKRVYQVASS